MSSRRCGAWRSVRLGVPGEDRRNVYGALEFLSAINRGERPFVGRRAAVIGGGNTALDCARAALRLGAEEVTVIYRRSRAEMPAADEELLEAEAEGVRFKYLAAPAELLGAEDVSAVRLNLMQLGAADASGRRSVQLVVEAVEGA